MLPKCFAESTFGFVGCRRLPKRSKPVVVRPRNRKCDHTTDNWRASRETEEENLTFALRIEHQSTLRAFNLIPVKLDFFDHPFTCPLCKEQIVYTSMHTVIVSSLRKCPCRQGELLINEGTITAAITDKKAPKRVVLAAAKRSRK